MKTIRFIYLLFTILIFGQFSFAQSKCEESLIDYTSTLSPDTLDVKLNLIFSVKSYEDIPFYEEVKFTSSPRNPQYFLLKKVNPDANVNYKIFDWDNSVIETETEELATEGESLISLKKHQSGNYKMILYSKSPDGSCISLTKLKSKNSSTQMAKRAFGVNFDSPQLDLLKEYDAEVTREDLPYLKEYSYVFTKNTDYYFVWENNENLNLKVTNRKGQELEQHQMQGENEIVRLNCESTGIYYFNIYAKNALMQDATLKLYYDKSSRSNN